jgi:hypothetical protein
MMIRLLLAILGGVAAWRYRGPIKKYVNEQLPQLQQKATEMFGDARRNLDTAGRSPAERPEGRL